MEYRIVEYRREEYRGGRPHNHNNKPNDDDNKQKVDIFKIILNKLLDVHLMLI